MIRYHYHTTPSQRNLHAQLQQRRKKNNPFNIPDDPVNNPIPEDLYKFDINLEELHKNP